MASNNLGSPLSNKPLYEEIAVIGNGAYGTVYKGYDLKTSRVVAMKRIRIQITQEGLPISTIREIAYLRHLEKYDHDNIVKLLDVINGPRLISEQSVILIFEFVDFDLHNYMRSTPTNLSLAKITDLMKQILNGIDFLHSNRIIHRDLKPQNILVTKDGKIKIADFGLARIYGFSIALTSVVVTLWYRSPEVLLHSTYSSSVDMWSLGCIFAELYVKRPLFAGKSDIDQLYKIFDVLGLPSEADWPVSSVIPLESFRKNINLTKSDSQLRGLSYLRELLPLMDNCALDLIMAFLHFNLGQRITARDALNHSFFHQTNSNKLTSQCLSITENIQSPNDSNPLKKSDDLTCNEINSLNSNKKNTFSDLTNQASSASASASSNNVPNILKRKRFQSSTNGTCGINSKNSQTMQNE